MSYILVLNCGSSSIKFSLIDSVSEKTTIFGLFENINSPNAKLKLTTNCETKILTYPNTNYKLAFTHIKDQLSKLEVLNKIEAIGHRVVHGGSHFEKSVIINPIVMEAIKDCIILAPLHNPANVAGIEFCQNLFPSLLQIAVFDTAFHQSLPKQAYTLALPKDLTEKYAIRKYGFHGTSHHYVSIKAAETLEMPYNRASFITAHLGNGCSICAIKNGESVDTTMSFTPLDGVVMGTRSGSIDPGIFPFLQDQASLCINDINTMLNKKSGLLGLCGNSDMREIEELATKGNKDAQLAINVFCFSIAKAIASMMISLTKLDALVFTGGIGENSINARKIIIKHLAILGFKVDDTLNKLNGSTNSHHINSKGSQQILVIKTNEELMIANDTIKLTSS